MMLLKRNTSFTLRLLMAVCVVILCFIVSFNVNAADDSTGISGMIQIEEQTYNITDVKTLVATDLALIQWDAVGNSTNDVDSIDKISGIFNGNTFSGYWAVYEEIYKLLLQNSQELSGKTLSNTDVLANQITILKVSKDDRGYFQMGWTHTANGGTLIILSEDAETLKTTDAGRLVVNTGGTLVVQGRSQTKKIKFTHLVNDTYGTSKDKDLITVSNGSLYISNCEFSDYNLGSYSTILFPVGNYARYMYMANSSLSNITAGEAGGIFCTVYNSTTNDDQSEAEKTKLFINNSTFKNCTTSGGNTRGGSAIRSYAADRSTLYVKNCLFDSNSCTATGQASGGGAIYWKSAKGTATLDSCTFVNNTATKVGGAVYNTGDMEIIGCHFYNNSATDSGGAIAVEPPYTSEVYGGIPANELSGSLILDQLTVIENNDADNYGGGIYFNAYASQITPNHQINTFSMELLIDGATISSNSAKWGGGIAMWLDYKERTYTTGITINAGSSIIDNTATSAGGAIWMSSNTDCSCNSNKGVNLNGGTLSGNTANNGGAIYINAGKPGAKMDFKMNGGYAQSNTASENGGAAYIQGGTMTVSGGMIKENTAKNGGGAYVNAGSADYGILVTGGSITNNTADQNGGGVAVNNGYYKMTGGNVDRNTATTGNGGGIYVSSTDIKVNVSVFSGSVTYNNAGTSGGAVAVSGGSDSDIQVTLGVNLEHGENIQCDHDDDNNRTAYTCPVIESNHAGKSGGAIYIIGGKSTKLDTFCLVEHKDRANSATATPSSSTSNFMMVEGGTVHLSTANTDNSSNSHGNISINGTIHVNAGDMTIDGSMANPMINATITVDVTTERGSFTDNRENPNNPSSEETYYKVQYFENFLDPVTQKKTGQYKVFQVLKNSTHTILPTLYQHDGYMIDGWWTTEFSDVAGSIEYEVNKGYTITDDLILYAKWLPIGYYVYFSPGTDSYDGSMETVRYNWDVTESLPQNKFFNKGYIFVGWDRDNDGDQDYTDKQSVVNLTQERSITLTAVWTLCDHQEAYFTYSTSGANTLVRTCSCKACTQRATILAENVVYDGNKHEPRISITTEVTNSQNAPGWSLIPQYSGCRYPVNGQSDVIPNNDPEFLVGAGQYTVTISGTNTITEVTPGQDGNEDTVTTRLEEVIVTVPFEILKAKRQPPAKPMFKSNETDNNVVKGKIVIISPNDPLQIYLEYHVEWYEAGGEKKFLILRIYLILPTMGLISVPITRIIMYMHDIMEIVIIMIPNGSWQILCYSILVMYISS